MRVFEPTPFNRVIAGVYSAITAARNFSYDRGLLKEETVPVFTVCVGNVTVGGSGKTPFAAHLARHLLERGAHPVLLSRGYGGSRVGPSIISPEDSPADVGDEAVMLRSVLPSEIEIVVARDRLRGSRFIRERSLGDVVILDDGFQHRRLARDLNLLVCGSEAFEGGGFFFSSRHFPAGRLRENPSHAFARADALVVIDSPEKLIGCPPALDSKGKLVPVFRLSRRPGALRDGVSGAAVTIREPVTAAAAIGQPEQFLSMLESAGVAVRQTAIFSDHHSFTPADWNRIRQHGGDVVCTAKDAVKLRQFVTEEHRLYVLELALEFFSEEEEEGLWKLIEAKRVVRV